MPGEPIAAAPSQATLEFINLWQRQLRYVILHPPTLVDDDFDRQFAEMAVRLDNIRALASQPK